VAEEWSLVAYLASRMWVRSFATTHARPSGKAVRVGGQDVSLREEKKKKKKSDSSGSESDPTPSRRLVSIAIMKGGKREAHGCKYGTDCLTVSSIFLQYLDRLWSVSEFR